MSRLPRVLAWSLQVSIPLLSTACADGGPDSEPSCVLRAPCDILNESCQREIFVATACARDQSDATMPTVRVVDRDEVASETRTTFSDSDARFWQRSWPLFGLTPRDESSADAQVDEYVSFVGAYYEDSAFRVTLVRNAFSKSNVANTILLSHEFTHALQYQRVDFGRLHEEFGDSSDARDSLASLQEGEAAFIADLTYLNSVHVDAAYADWKEQFEANLERRLKVLETSPSPLLSAWRLVYPVGEYGVVQAYLESGLAGIDDIYRHPPRTFLGRIDPAREESRSKLTCAPPAPPEGFTLRAKEQNGVLGLLALYVASQLGVRYEEAQEWDDDWYAVYGAENDTASDKLIALWRIRLRSEDAAKALTAALGRSPVEFDFAQQGSDVVLLAASDSGVVDDDWAELAKSDPACDPQMNDVPEGEP